MAELNQFADATTGVVFIHAAPVAMCVHVEWALASTLDSREPLSWSAQPASEGSQKTVIDWVGEVGTGAKLTASLASWGNISFEVTEDPSELVDGERFSFVPELGLWRGQTAANGDVVVSENRLRSLLARGVDTLTSALETELGVEWDRALEPLRGAGTTAEVTWLSRVG